MNSFTLLDYAFVVASYDRVMVGADQRILVRALKQAVWTVASKEYICCGSKKLQETHYHVE